MIATQSGIQWYCVRIDHAAALGRRPLLVEHEDSWAYCRSGDGEAEHTWSPTRGASILDLYGHPSGAGRRGSLVWADHLRDELREAIGWTSCVFEIARHPTNLRISFDEPTGRPTGARLSLDITDHEGTVGRVTLTDMTRASYADVDVHLLRLLLGPYAEKIRSWLSTTA